MAMYVIDKSYRLGLFESQKSLTYFILCTDCFVIKVINEFL